MNPTTAKQKARELIEFEHTAPNRQSYMMALREAPKILQALLDELEKK